MYKQLSKMKQVLSTAVNDENRFLNNSC